MNLKKSTQVIFSGIICLFLGFETSFGQVEVDDLDSMILQLEVMTEDEAKVDHLVSIAKSLIYNDPNLALDYVHQAINLAIVLDYENGDIYKTRGNIHYTQSDYMDALEDYLLSLEYFNKVEDTLNIANVYNNLGILYEDQGNCEEARNYYSDALEIYKALHDFHGQATIYLNLGWLYDNMGQQDSSIFYSNKSLAINSEIKDDLLEAILHTNIGRAYMHKESYDSASRYFDMGMEGYTLVRDIEGVTEVNRYMGEMYMMQGKYSDGLKHLDKAEEFATRHMFKELLVETYELKSRVYKEIGDFESSLEYHQKFKVLSDSIFTAEKDRALYALQIKQIHEQETEALNQQNQLQEEQLNSAKFKNYLLLAISIFSLLVMLIATYYFMNKQKTSLQLKQQNVEIREQQKEIEKQQNKLARVNKDLQNKNLSLNKLNKEKDYLLHVVAHDLKGPLNQMAGLSQVIRLEESNLSETQMSCVEKIETVSTRLSNMVDKILDIDAIEKKSSNLAMEELDLREILDETIEEFESVARIKKITIHQNLNGAAAMVKIDRQHALQVFENLISNAIKFSPPNKDVFVSIREDSDEVVAEVKDQGPGLTEDDFKKVFKKQL
jgi:signal transduction histidine kinase